MASTDDVTPAGAEVFTGGPYLLVAAPNLLADVLPLNCSTLLREWEERLDPAAAAKRAAAALLPKRSWWDVRGRGPYAATGDERDWRIAERFVVPTFSTRTLLRSLMRDDEFVGLIEASDALLLGREQDPVTVNVLANRAAEGNDIQPLLLGLAVASTVMEPLGLVGRTLHRRFVDTRTAATGQQEAASAAEDASDGASVVPADRQERWHEGETETLEEWERMEGVWPSRYHDQQGTPVPARDAAALAEIITSTCFDEPATSDQRGAALLASTRTMRHLIDNYEVTSNYYETREP